MSIKTHDQDKVFRMLLRQRNFHLQIAGGEIFLYVCFVFKQLKAS